MLSTENLSIGYKRGAPVFSGINFHVNEGEMVAVLGVNGIGKSTLLRTLANLQEAAAGEVMLQGSSIALPNLSELALHISVVLTERVYIDNITVREFVAMGRAPHTGWFGNMNEEDYKVLKGAIHETKLEEMQDRLFNELSDGEKQRVLIARAVCQNTQIMILDEPTAYLDFRHKKSIYDLLRQISTQLKTLIIFSTHDIEAALQYADTFWLMTEDKKFEVVNSFTPNYEKLVKEKLKIGELV